MSKKNNNKPFNITQLSGTPKMQALQLLEILKDKTLDIDSLKVLLPANVDVMKEFISCMRVDIEANQQAYGRVVGILEVSLSNLQEIIKDGKIDSNERMRCFDEISKIHQLICDLQKEHDKNLKDFWKTISGYIFALLAITVVVTSGGKIKPPTK